MIADPLSEDEKLILLRLARQSIELAVCKKDLPELCLRDLPIHLQEEASSFVTLTRQDRLRGCIGSLQAYQPLAEDVREHAVAAALQDWRFHPVRIDEVPWLRIEVSRLTAPMPLTYTCPEDLLPQLTPGVDGVILQFFGHRATFLPQVWEKIPDPSEFLGALCNKMGANDDLWKREILEVSTYQVEAFEEECAPMEKLDESKELP